MLSLSCAAPKEEQHNKALYLNNASQKREEHDEVVSLSCFLFLAVPYLLCSHSVTFLAAFTLLFSLLLGRRSLIRASASLLCLLFVSLPSLHVPNLVYDISSSHFVLLFLPRPVLFLIRFSSPPLRLVFTTIEASLSPPPFPPPIAVKR